MNDPAAPVWPVRSTPSLARYRRAKHKVVRRARRTAPAHGHTLYDAAGSRVSTGGTWARTGLPSAVASATYNAANEQTAFAGTTQTFDLNGNMTSDGTNTYTWDVRNQLASLSGSVSASFAYDALGRRRSKTISSTQTKLHYDGLTPVQELDSGGTVTANLLTGLGIDEYLARSADGSTRSYLTDILGSTVAELDDSVTTQAAYTYEAFGETTVSGSSGNAFRYTGREEDDGTGLYYYRARYYHPGRARFVAEDPIAFAGGGTNLHSYARDNPLSYTDPLGLTPGAMAGAIVGGAVAGPPGAAVGALAGLGVGLAIGAIIVQSSAWDDVTGATKERCETEQERCNREWEEAFRTCRELLSKPSPDRRGRTGGHANLYDCARGFVSEACGGNPVDWGSTRKTGGRRR